MFTFAFGVGIYSYLIFFLGLAHVLTTEVVLFVSFLWFISLSYILKRKIIVSLVTLFSWHFSLKSLKKHKLLTLLSALLFIDGIVNMLGALGPEYAFDALWYHLTLPKLYLLHHAIYHIPGGLLYYSDMPKLGEMLYVGGLTFGGAIGAKLIHFSFGILCCIALYKLSRRYISSTMSLLAVVIFYSNIVVAWESTTAYIDLIRTFFEMLGFWGLVNWVETKSLRWLTTSTIMIGLAITTKLLSIGSLVLFCLFIVFRLVHLYRSSSPRIAIAPYLLNIIRLVCLYLFIALLIPLPWFIFSYIHTGNPVFPFFTHTYEVAPEPASLIGFFKETWTLFTHASDPISPMYLITLPLLFATWKTMKKELKYLTVFSGAALIVWYFTPRTGGGRFILPYLPVFSILVAAAIDQTMVNKKQFKRMFSVVLLTLVLLVSLITIVYRGAANAKYIPVILGKESKQHFLTTHLNFSFGDFYDVDGYFATHIKPTDRVLLFGFHNLYYIDFPFIDSSWTVSGDTFNYIAVQHGKLPARYQNWHLVYKNDKTLVQLYKPPTGLCNHICNY